ncbi:unnamed protein product [Dibothriocephalus latus]|uniref:4Fe-4S ferredoxin-type domain-containing protein n=1 Tax=Dibothriocephalus latus TaxID=60516 RepID=A0A3P6VFY7_DIBLA|nr:unnamed protein product [Dibothriocephalus latus]
MKALHGNVRNDLLWKQRGVKKRAMATLPAFLLKHFLPSGFYRKCIDQEGHVDVKKMISCQACPSLEPFLERLFQSQMVHCLFEDRLKEQLLDPFETRCRSLTDSCLARCPPGAINFGDALWITCKRNATSGGLRRYNRIRQKFSRSLFKNSFKGKGKYERDHALLTIDGANGGDASWMSRSVSFNTSQANNLDSAVDTHRPLLYLSGH